MTIHTILFDLDGTLVQHLHVLLPEKLTEWGHPRSPAHVDRAFAVEIHWFYEYVAELQASGHENDAAWQQLWPLFYQRVVRQLEIDDDTIIVRMSDYFEAEPTPPLFEDALPLLEALVGDHWRLGVITQRSRAGAVRFLREHGLLERFQIIVAGDDGYGRKPAPDPFHHALGYLKSHPQHAIFVGDRIDDDCGGACSAGVSAFLIDRDNQYVTPPAESPQFVRLTTLLDLLDHLPPPNGGSGHG